MKLKYRRDLPALMRELNLPMIGVEVGVAEGYFSNDLLEGGIEKLYCVDIWNHEEVTGDGSMDQEWHNKNYRATMHRIAKHIDKAVILKGFSEAMSTKVPDNSLGLVYIDAGHSYPDVFMDLTIWLPKLVKGGICAGHDYLNQAYGVKRAVEDFTNGKYEVHLIPEDKDEDAGFWFLKK